MSSLSHARKVGGLVKKKSQEAVAIRVGDYKLLINSPNDGWYRPAVLNASIGWYLNTECTYDWYDLTSGVNCGWTNWLFDLKKDPYERTNLFDSPKHKAIKDTLLDRVYEIMDHDYGNESSYGAKMYETYKRTSNSESNTESMDASFKKHNYWVVPWDCEVLK